MVMHLRGGILVDAHHGPADRPRDITVRDGIIVGIDRVGRPAPEDEVIELDGRFVTGGLVNAHDHLYSHELRTPRPGWGLAEMRAWLDARDLAHTLFVMLREALRGLAAGITTVRDVGANHGSNVALVSALRSTGITGPTIVAAARPIVMTGGHVCGFGREADGPWDCRRAVREQVKAGARVIKIMASGGLSHYPDEDFDLPQFTEEELHAIVDEAHANGVPTCAHAFGPDAVHRAVLAGVDSVEHGVDVRDETLELMAARGVGYVPTLANMRRIASAEFNHLAGTADRHEILQNGVVAPHSGTFQRARERGVRIGVGTDSTGTYGEELAAMQQLGMPPIEILRAATVDGAAICRQDADGLVAGQRADLAIHDADPLDEPVRLVEPSMVYARGRRVDPTDVRRMAPIG